MTERSVQGGRTNTKMREGGKTIEGNWQQRDREGKEASG